MCEEKEQEEIKISGDTQNICHSFSWKMTFNEDGIVYDCKCEREEMKVESCCPNCRPDLYYKPTWIYPMWPWGYPIYPPYWPNYPQIWCETTANSGTQ